MSTARGGQWRGQAVRRATAGVVAGDGCPRSCPCMECEAWPDDAGVDSAEARSAVDRRSCVVGVAKVQVEGVLVVGVEVATAVQAAPAAR